MVERFTLTEEELAAQEAPVEGAFDEAEELEEGYVLVCQSIPTAARVTVEYD